MVFKFLCVGRRRVSVGSVSFICCLSHTPTTDAMQKGLKRRSRRKRKELVSLASIRCYDVTKGEGGVVTALSVRTTHVLFYFNIYILVPFYFKGHEHTMEAEAAKSVM